MLREWKRQNFLSTETVVSKPSKMGRGGEGVSSQERGGRFFFSFLLLQKKDRGGGNGSEKRFCFPFLLKARGGEKGNSNMRSEEGGEENSSLFLLSLSLFYSRERKKLKMKYEAIYTWKKGEREEANDSTFPLTLHTHGGEGEGEADEESMMPLSKKREKKKKKREGRRGSIAFFCESGVWEFNTGLLPLFLSFRKKPPFSSTGN